MWKLQGERSSFVARFYERWNATASRTKSKRPVDAILCPAMASLAPRHDRSRYVGYTAFANIIDSSAVVLPHSTCDKSTDLKPAYEPRNDAEAHVWSEYDVELLHGAPVALQLVARRLEEEKLLAIAAVVDRLSRM